MLDSRRGLGTEELAEKVSAGTNIPHRAYQPTTNSQGGSNPLGAKEKEREAS